MVVVEELDPEFDVVLVVAELDELLFVELDVVELDGFEAATCVTVGCFLTAGFGMAVVLAEALDSVGVVGVDAVVDVVVVDATNFVECCFAWWRRVCAFDFVVVSDFGGVVRVVAAVDGVSVVLLIALSGVAADEAAGASSATTIAPAPSAAPTPVAAVTRRTRRRTRSRWAAAIARLVASMSLPSTRPLRLFLTGAVDSL